MTTYLDTARTDADSVSDHVSDHNALHDQWNYDNVGTAVQLLPNDSSQMNAVGASVAWDANRNLWIASADTQLIDFSWTLYETAYVEAQVICAPADLTGECTLIIAADAAYANKMIEVKLQGDENAVVYNGAGASQGAISSGTGSWTYGALIDLGAAVIRNAGTHLATGRIGPSLGLESDKQYYKAFDDGQAVTTVASGGTVYGRIDFDDGWGVVKLRAVTH